MNASRPRPGPAFDDVVLARTGADFVERRWLYDAIERALESEEGQYVLVTGEPGAGKTSLLAGIARAHPDRLRYFFRRDSRTAVTGGDTESFLLSIGHQLAGRARNSLNRNASRSSCSSTSTPYGPPAGSSASRSTT
nr:ATP-binding protein [Streptomyces sp. NBC_00830]